MVNSLPSLAFCSMHQIISTSLKAVYIVTFSVSNDCSIWSIEKSNHNNITKCAQNLTEISHRSASPYCSTGSRLSAALVYPAQELIYPMPALWASINTFSQVKAGWRIIVGYVTGIVIIMVTIWLVVSIRIP